MLCGKPGRGGTTVTYDRPSFIIGEKMYKKVENGDFIFYVEKEVLDRYEIPLLSYRQLSGLAIAKISKDDQRLIKILDETYGVKQ
jgi:hypothetical protein